MRAPSEVLNRRQFIDPNGENNRQVRTTITARHPGHMVHLDVKKVGHIPDGGGWRGAREEPRGASHGSREDPQFKTVSAARPIERVGPTAHRVF